MASISDEVREELEALRSRESTDDSVAVVLMIDPDTMSVVSDETYEDITLDELAEEGGQSGRHTEHLSSFKDILQGDHNGHARSLVSDLDF